LIAGLPVLKINPAARSLAERIFRATTLPDKAEADALHIAVAAVNAMDFLLTWNCTHLANGVVLKIVKQSAGITAMSRRLFVRQRS